MKKQKIQLLILVVLCVTLFGAFFGIRYYQKTKATQNEAEEQTYPVLALTKEEVAAFSYSNGTTGASLVQEEDGWCMKDDAQFVLDTEKVDSLLQNVLTIQADMEITGVTDFAQYGFDDPLAEVALTLQDGTVYELVFGHFNEITSQYYLRVNGKDTVYVLSDNLGYHFQISPDDLKKVEEVITDEKEVTTE